MSVTAVRQGRACAATTTCHYADCSVEDPTTVLDGDACLDPPEADAGPAADGGGEPGGCGCATGDGAGDSGSTAATAGVLLAAGLAAGRRRRQST